MANMSCRLCDLPVRRSVAAKKLWVHHATLGQVLARALARRVPPAHHALLNVALLPDTGLLVETG